MVTELKHVAVPILYGAPAHGRPRRIVPTELPLDRDDLPISAAQTEQEQSIVEKLLAVPYQSVGLARAVREEPHAKPRPPLRALADRFLRRVS